MFLQTCIRRMRRMLISHSYCRSLKHSHLTNMSPITVNTSNSSKFHYVSHGKTFICNRPFNNHFSNGKWSVFALNLTKMKHCVSLLIPPHVCTSQQAETPVEDIVTDPSLTPASTSVSSVTDLCSDLSFWRPLRWVKSFLLNFLLVLQEVSSFVEVVHPLSRTTGLELLAIFLAGGCVVLVEVQTLPQLISRSPAGFPLLGVWSAHNFLMPGGARWSCPSDAPMNLYIAGDNWIISAALSRISCLIRSRIHGKVSI